MKSIKLHIINIFKIIYHTRNRGLGNLKFLLYYLKCLFGFIFLNRKYVFLKNNKILFADLEQVTTPLTEYATGHYPKINLQPTILDLGSNIGMIPHLYHIDGYDDIKYIGYEADPFIYQYCSTNTKCFGICYNFAVADTVGEMIFYSEKNSNKTGSTLLIRENETDKYISNSVKTLPIQQAINGLNVDLLKVDIEGAEFLIDWQQLDFSKVHKFMIEIHPNKDASIGKLLFKIEAISKILIRSDSTPFTMEGEFYNLVVSGVNDKYHRVS